MANFLCDCGTVKVIYVSDWKSGKTLSCGCLNSELVKERSTTHGESNTRLYRSWASMIVRSTRGGPFQWKYPAYWGVDRWRGWDTFEGFRTTMPSGYEDDLALCRTGDEGSYEPGNTRWDTPSNNAREANELSGNMRKTTDGRFGLDVVRVSGISENTYYKRIGAKWSVDEACGLVPRGKP